MIDVFDHVAMETYLAKTSWMIKCSTGYASFRKLTGMAYNRNTRLKYFQFLGFTKIIEWNDLYVAEVPESAIRRVEWIRGPNAKFLYKMWVAQNGET